MADVQHDFDDDYFILGYKDGYTAIGCKNSRVVELYVPIRDGEGNPAYYFQGLRLEFCGSETVDDWEAR